MGQLLLFAREYTEFSVAKKLDIPLTCVRHIHYSTVHHVL